MRRATGNYDLQETLRKVKKSNLHIPASLSQELKDLFQNVINWVKYI